jgi:hypothetical protein
VRARARAPDKIVDRSDSQVWNKRHRLCRSHYTQGASTQHPTTLSQISSFYLPAAVVLVRREARCEIDFRGRTAARRRAAGSQAGSCALPLPAPGSSQPGSTQAGRPAGMVGLLGTGTGTTPLRRHIHRCICAWRQKRLLHLPAEHRSLGTARATMHE